MFFGIAIFLLIALGLIFGLHYVFYQTVVAFFGLGDIARSWFLWTLAFLSISFLLASAISHFRDNIFTRHFYIFSSIWLGFLWDFFLGCLFIWLIRYTLIWMGKDFTLALIAWPIFSASFLISCYAVWGAYNPVIRNIDVRIKDLPDAWQGQTIVQLSDVHLGHVYRRDFLQEVVDRVNTVNPKAVVITGDLFDGMDGDLSHLLEPIDGIKAKEKFFVTGNHETYIGLDRSLDAISQTSLTNLNDKMMDVDGLQFLGVAYPSRGQSVDMDSIAQEAGIDNKRPLVLLYHEPRHIDEARAIGVDLQLSGHVHLGQMFPFSWITRSIYGRFAYGLNTIGDYNIYTTDGVGTWGPPLRTGNRPEIVAIKLMKK